MTLYANQISKKEFRFTVCKEAFMTVPVVMYTLKNFFLLDVFNEKIEIFNAAGLIDHWGAQEVDKRFLKLSEVSDIRVLSLEDFVGCFQVLLIGFIISFITFLLELVQVRIKQVFDCFQKSS